MNIEEKRLRLYAILGNLPNDQMLTSSAEKAILGGIDILQLREKELAQQEYVRRASLLLPICQKHKVPLIINDNISVCLLSGADGVHLGQSDGSIQKARQVLGEEKIIGATAHNLSEALQAEAQGADYLGVGAAFGSRTKKDAIPIEHAEYRRITDAVKIPVIAIGGIDSANISMLQDSGIAGVAVISAIFSQPDIQEAASQLKEECVRLFAKSLGLIFYHPKL